MAGPLAGVRVLDLGRFIACPFCGMLLADLGAEVIRVERPGGSEDRFLGLLSPSGDNYSFINQNRNKKGITLDFERSEKARKILMELVRHADAVIENFSEQAARAFGVTYEKLKEVKPDIIYAHISAFGTDGPYSHRIGFDQIAKAMSGSMSISGFPGDPPTREAVNHIDYGTGMLTALGVVTALYHRNRTGEGQMIDTALLQTAVTCMATAIGEWEVGRAFRTQLGNRGWWCGPVDTYLTKDKKWVVLSLPTTSLWRRFCRFIGREDLAVDQRFQSDFSRWEHRDLLDPVVKEWVSSLTAEEVIDACERIPIPCGLCNEYTEVAHDPQVKAREMLVEIPTPSGGVKIPATGIPLRMSQTKLQIERSFPAVGEHNHEIYSEILGYGGEELALLQREGII